MNKEDYNKELVEYCKVCRSLNIVDTKHGALCDSCGALNYTTTASTIFEYLENEEKIDKDISA